MQLCLGWLADVEKILPWDLAGSSDEAKNYALYLLLSGLIRTKGRVKVRIDRQTDRRDHVDKRETWPFSFMLHSTQKTLWPREPHRSTGMNKHRTLSSLGPLLFAISFKSEMLSRNVSPWNWAGRGLPSLISDSASLIPFRRHRQRPCQAYDANASGIINKRAAESAVVPFWRHCQRIYFLTIMK